MVTYNRESLETGQRKLTASHSNGTGLRRRPPVVDKTTVKATGSLQGRSKSRAIAPAFFDPDFYAAQIGLPRLPFEKLVAHYRSAGHKTASPTPLFDPIYYRTQLLRMGRRVSDDLDLYSDYLANGWRERCDPHPLFDGRYYSAMVGIPDDVCPLVHYLSEGWKRGASPHLFFDPLYYCSNEPSAVGEPALNHYLKRVEWDSTPHPLFSDSCYLQSARACGAILGGNRYIDGPPLVHYIRVGEKHELGTHPLFSADYYRRLVSAQKKTSLKAGHQEQGEIVGSAFRHYCLIGRKHGLSPSPYVDLKHTAAALGVTKEEDVVGAYLSGGYRRASPHPALDLEFYRSRAGRTLPGDLPAILHLIAARVEDRILPNPVFDKHFYLADNEDVRAGNLCPILHYLEHGWREGRRPNAMFSHLYAHSKSSTLTRGFNAPVAAFLEQSLYRRPAIVFLGHDASRTGAPLILLNLVRQVSRNTDVECYTILGAGGPLVEEFTRCSHTYVLKEYDRGFLDWYSHSSRFKDELAFVDRSLRNLNVMGVVCNSLESRHLADYLVKLGYGPLTTLIHEAADSYQPRQLLDTITISNQVVFPSEYTLRRARKVGHFSLDNVSVVPQGLLAQGFGNGDRAVARRRITKELGLPNDATIVIGCGTTNRRKGIDIFVDAACRVIDKLGPNAPYFLWIGDGPSHHDSAYWWATRQIAEHESEEHIRLIGEREDPEPYFLAASAFLLTSRIDPLPCVAHEAMASGLPMIAIAGNSGSVEYAEESCIAVAEDPQAIADALVRLLCDEDKTHAMGHRAKQIIKERGDFADYTKKILTILSKGQPTRSLEGIRLKSAEQRGKVIFLAPDWQVSGVNTFTENLVRHLVDAGFDARILFTRGMFTYSTAADEASFPTVPYEFLEPVSDQPEDVWRALRSYFLENRERCVVIPNYDFIASSVFPALPDHVRYLGILHSDDPEHYEHAYRLGIYWDRIVSVSNVINDRMLRLNQGFADRALIIPYGIPYSAKKATGQLRRRLKGIGSRPLQLVYVGRLVQKQKRVLDYVKLLRRLERLEIDYQMTFVGDGDMESVLQTALADLIKVGRVKMTGRVSPGVAREIVAQSDVILLLSDFEGLPLSVLEALGAGCVPLTWRIDSGVGELIDDGVNGFLVPRGDYEGVAKVLSLLGSKRGVLKSMSLAAQRHFAESPYRIEVAGVRYASTIKAMLDDKCPMERPPLFTEYRGGVTPPIWMRQAS